MEAFQFYTALKFEKVVLFSIFKTDFQKVYMRQIIYKKGKNSK